MSKRALLFGGTDGHGIIMTALSERTLQAEGYEVFTVCSFVHPPDEKERTISDYGTGIPCFFWQYTFPYYMRNACHDYQMVIVVDIPFPEPDNRCPSFTADRVVEEIESAILQGLRIVIIDHHKNSFTHYGKVAKVGAEVIISSSALFTHYGPPDAYTLKWGRYGAICDRDSAVLPVTYEEEIFAARIDKAKVKVSESLDAVRQDNTSFFEGFSPDISMPEVAEVYDSFVYIPKLAVGNGYKQLDQACRKYGKEYALGVTYQNPDKPVILLITYWKSENLPVALLLGMNRFRGHVNAPNLDYSPDLEKKLLSLLTHPYTGDLIRTEPVSSDNFYSYVASFLKTVEIPYFLTLHKWGHVEHVIANGRTLGSFYGLTDYEQMILDWACLLHDIGYGVDHAVCPDFNEIHRRHHEFSEQMVRSWEKEGVFSGFLSHEDVDLIADMCLRHRKKMSLPGGDKDHLYILLRAADALDNDFRRAVKNDQGENYDDIKDMSEESRREWEAHQAVKGVRLFASDNHLIFEMIVSDQKKAFVKIQDLKLETELLKRYFSVKVLVSELYEQAEVN